VALSPQGGHGKLPFQQDFPWVDQLCIDQEDGREKSHQVKQMGDIFANADAVIIWLGTPMGYSWAARDALEVIAEEFKCANNEVRSTGQDLGEFQDLIQTPSGDFYALLQNDYWGRLWVVQEILLAKRHIIACGNQHTDWDTFKPPSMQ
jgi:hypothetical protein